MTTANLAALYGLNEAAYTAVRDDFATQTRQAATDLLADPNLAAALGRLPFSPGSTVLVIGESTTDAADSWLEILTHLLAHGRPDDAINLVNAGISGYPTTMLQRVLSAMLLRHQPDWVVVFAGANDILRYGAGAAKPLVHITETTRNLAELRRLAVSAGARLIWMTPTGYDIQRAASYPPFQAQQIWLQDDDAVALDQAVRDRVKDEDIMVDLRNTFGRPPSRACCRPTASTPRWPASRQSPKHSPRSSATNGGPRTTAIPNRERALLPLTGTNVGPPGDVIER